MGKLFNLKKWLTVADAAKHLSIVFGENIADADVLQLGLDGHLRLSVYFADYVKVQRKKLVQYVHYEDEGDAPPMLTDNDSMWLPILDGYASVRGLWDLPMIGTEWFDIENRYRNLINNPPVTIQGLGGASVEGLDGEICRLQMEYDESDRPLHEPLRGAMIVVRTDALREFEASINGSPAPTERAHLSDKLARMNQAAAKFWGNADRDDRGTHPENAAVTAWLVQQGFSQTLADKAATLIRPEWAPTGRRPEE